MSLWDSVSDVLSGGGRGDVNDAYKRADEYMAPYREGGLDDYNKMRKYSGMFGDSLSKYKDAGNYRYDQINQSPNAYYDKLMGGYNESPDAKYAQEQAFNASTRGASASGMLGSGAQLKELQENANQISQRDRQQYFDNILNTDKTQMGYLNNLQGENSKYQQMLQYLTSLGFSGAGGMSENAINLGDKNAKFDQQAFDSIMALLGAGGQNFKNNSAVGGAGGGGIPWYMMLM